MWIFPDADEVQPRGNGAQLQRRAVAARMAAADADQQTDPGRTQKAHLGHVDDQVTGRSRGCVAQAWSVAELLRAAVEDVYADRFERKGQASPAAG